MSRTYKHIHKARLINFYKKYSPRQWRENPAISAEHDKMFNPHNSLTRRYVLAVRRRYSWTIETIKDTSRRAIGKQQAKKEIEDGIKEYEDRYAELEYFDDRYDEDGLFFNE